MTQASGSTKRSTRGLAREVSTDGTRRRAWWAARVCLGLAVVVAVLWQGAVDPTALWVMWGLCALGWLASVPHIPVRRTRGTVAFLWMGLGAYTALLLLPLPRGFVAAVHPAAVQISDASRLALGLPHRASLPIAIATGDAALQVALYLIAGALALLYGHGLMLPNARPRAVRDGDWLGYLCAIAGVLWLLAHAPYVSSALPASLRIALRQWALINPNHVAGLCAVSVAFSMARMLRSEDIARRNAYLSLTVVLAATAVMTGSRGGVLAVIFVAAASLASMRFKWLRTRTPTDEVTRRKRIDLMLKVLTATIVCALLAVPFIEAEILPSFARGTDDAKLKLFSFAVDQVDGGWLLGRGPGALPVALGIAGVTTTTRADFAENIVLERFLDQGIWGSLPFFAVLTWLMVSTAGSLRRGSPGIAPWLACCGLLLQNLADFSLEIAGGLIPFLLAAIQAERLRSSTPHSNRRREGGAKHARGLVLGTSLAALLVAGVALANAGEGLTRTAPNRLKLLDLPAAKQLVAARFGHDQYAFFVLCRKAADRRDYPAAVRLCSRALTLWPASESARVVRFAASLDAGDDRFVAGDLVMLLRGSKAIRDRTLTICAEQPQAEKLLSAALVAAPEVSYLVGRFLITTRPGLVERLALNLREALPNRAHGIEVLRGELYVHRRLYRAADRIATQLIGDPKLSVHGWALQGHIFERQGKFKEALPLLDWACGAFDPGHPVCIDAMLAASRGLPPRQALRYVQQHFVTVRGNPSREHEYWLVLGRLYFKLEAYEDAIAAAQRAQGLKKNAPRALALAATAQLAVGDWRAATRLIQRLPRTKAWQKRRLELAAEVSETRASGRL